MTSNETSLFRRRRSIRIASALILVVGLTTTIGARAQSVTTLLSFDGANGSYPYGGLIQARNGYYYGTTNAGGANSCEGNGCGTLFEVTATGALTTLYNFCSQSNCADGDRPGPGLVLGIDGSLYGATFDDGPYWYGTVFSVTPAGKLTTLYSFCRQINCPISPYSSVLLQARDANFYGTTSGGGAHGSVFKMTPKGKVTMLYHFCSQSNCADGADPYGAALIQYGGTPTSEGSFYGTTLHGGDADLGTIFKITPSGKFTRLYSFCSQNNCTDGFDPIAGLTKAAAGDLHFYGTTYGGGLDNCIGNVGCGTVFKITPTGTLTTLYKFCSQSNCPDGANPFAGLVLGTDGNYYGTTTAGGAYGNGTIFQITPTGALTTLYSFCSQSNCTDGTAAYGLLLQATNGTFYGTTLQGGSNNEGTVYSLNMSLGPFVSLVRNTGQVGAQVEILGQGFTGTRAVSFNGKAAKFVIHSGTYLTATVPQGASTGFVAVTTPSGVLQSKTKFWVW